MIHTPILIEPSVQSPIVDPAAVILKGGTVGNGMTLCQPVARPAVNDYSSHVGRMLCIFEINKARSGTMSAFQ